MRRLILLCLAALLVGSVLAADGDQESLRHELQTLAQYPKPVREAILELLIHPKLLVALADGKDLEITLKTQKATVADAARVVAKYPNVLKLLRDYPEALAEAAKAYAADKKKVIDQLDQEENLYGKATEEWSQRLEGDQVALEQLQMVATAYAKQSGTSLMDAGIKNSELEVIVYSLPTPAFITYVMNNADVYPALSNVMVSQWLSSRNSAAYDRTFYHWWNRYQAHFHDSLLHPDGDRFHRLSELARYDRRFASVDAAHRYERFHDHAADFSHLGKHYSKDLKHTSLALHMKPDHKDHHAPGKDPHKHAHMGKHTKVHHRPPSHEHHMHHAHAGHHHHVQHHAGHKK
jgi:hypothetical protein